MKPLRTFAVALGVGLACAAATAQATDAVQTDLKNASGARIGTVTVTAAPKGVLLRIEATGLPPGWHGAHFHEKADCSDAAFTRSGGHVHGDGKLVHGLLNPEANDAGDLPNLYAAPDGSIHAELYSTLVALREGATGRVPLLDADGAALVIHANPDDYQSQPIGGAGARIACAELR